MKLETKLHQKIKPILENQWASSVYRIESFTSPGFADSFIAANGKFLLLELKMLIGDDIYLRPAQYNFALDIEETHNKYFVIAADATFNKYYLIKDFTRLKIAQRGNKKYIIINMIENEIGPQGIDEAIKELMNG